ncbi:hypothetical protein Mal52_60110 [Symmachiella dynata]|uniref:Uncharacterized protein n=1 Tax=Symmachiella dynata TaxID=2527995 RepID=A0A517ZYD3_9PLAN|nr:hypothetical protein [Symmachiella dynata]QDU47480.1 hypothetical protein Mal52_60110 [Symmachiella dynata]
MSQIGSIASNQTFASIQQQRGIAPSSVAETEKQRGAHFEQRIDNVLNSAGIDQETIDAIKTDLQTAFESSASSGSFPPAPDEMRDMVNSVFAEHGLDAEEILGRRGSGAPPGPPPPASLDDSTQDLSVLLESLLAGQQDPESSKLAESVLSLLVGFDTTA